MDKLKQKNLLMILHSYNNFQKDQVDIIAKYFNKVYVIVKYEPLAEIANIFPISSLKPFTKKHVVQMDNTPDNVEVYTTSLFYLPNPSGWKKAGYKLAEDSIRIIEKYKLKFDIVHAHFAWPCGCAGDKIKEKYNVPLVITSHGYDLRVMPLIDEDFKNKISDVLELADENITVGESSVKYLEYMGIKSDDVNVIGNGFDSRLFYEMDMITSRKELNLPVENQILLNIGYLGEVKGQSYLINAVSSLVKKGYNDLLCLIIGDGQIKKKLENQIKSLEMTKYIKLLGGKDHSKIPKYMNACDVFVLPSNSESFGVVQIEAMACGKPVVATANGGSEYIVTNENYGFLSPVKDVERLINNLEKAINKDWNKKSILSYSKKFYWTKICEDIVELYLKHL